MRKPQKSPACSSRTSAWKSETAPDFRHRQTASLLTERKRLRGWPESCCSERASVRREHEAERCSSSSESLRLKRSCHGQTSGLRSETQATAFLFHQRTIGRSLTSFYWNVSFHLLKIYFSSNDQNSMWKVRFLFSEAMQTHSTVTSTHSRESLITCPNPFSPDTDTCTNTDADKGTGTHTDTHKGPDTD